MRRHRLILPLILMFLITIFSPLVLTVDSQDPTIDITIAYTHDLHSHLYSEWTGTQCSGGMPLLSTKIQELRALRPTLLFDCGDILSGAPVNDINGGIPMIEVMNEIGYDAMALDNHEFDQGVGNLKNMIDTADFEVLGANVDWPGSPKPLDYSIESIAGYDIGVIGLAPQFWYAPDEATITDQATAANDAVVELQDLGIDFIILLGCLYPSLASSVSGIDIIIQAKTGGLQTIGDILAVPGVGIYSSQVGVLDLTINTNDGTIDSYNFSAHSLSSPLEPDENIVSIIDTWNVPLAPNLDLAVGYFDSFQSSSDLGVKLSNAVLQETGADVGIYNHGGIRENIDQGFVTYRDIYRVEPFFNTISTIELKGSDVESVIGSNYYSTAISSFEPETWYTVASTNFSVTYFENTYSTGARHDFSTTIVDTFADYVSSEYQVTSEDLLSVIDECKSSVSSLPDSYLTGGVASTLRLQIDTQLSAARNALVGDDENLAYERLVNAIGLVETHVNVSCPRRWLTININNVIASLELTTTTSTSSLTTITTSPPTEESWFMLPWIPLLVIIVIIPPILIIYSKFLKR